MHVQARRSSMIAAGLLIAVLAAIVACIDVAAQPVRIGPVAGYEYGVPLTVQRDAGEINVYRASGDGESSNHTAWFGAAIELRDLFAPSWSLAPRLALALSSGLFQSDPFTHLDTTASVRITTRSFDVSSSLSVFMFDAPMTLDLDEGWQIGLGPWLSYRFSSGFFQTETLHEPATFTYPDGRRVRTVDAGDELGGERLRVGMIASVSPRIALSERFWLRPEIYTRVDGLALLVEKLGLRSLSLGAALRVEIELADDTPAPASLADAPIAEPRASIELGLAAGSSLSSIGTIQRREIPARAVIRFEQASASLPVAYLMDRERARRAASIDSLAGLDIVELHHNALAVIADRLRTTPSATVSIVGMHASSEAASVASARAEAVAGALVDVFGVERQRIRTAARAGDAPVVIATPDASIDQPIVTRWVTRALGAPRISLRHSIDAPAGTRWWEIALRQGDRVITRMSHTSSDTMLAGAMSIDPGAGPIVAELAGSDSNGVRFTARDTLAVGAGVTKGPIVADHRESLLSVDGDPVEQAATIAASIRDGASIIVRSSRARSAFNTALIAQLDHQGRNVEQLRFETVDAPSIDSMTLVIVDQPYSATDN